MLKVYSIFDVKSDSYGTPFFVGTHGLAIRGFGDLAADPQSTVSRHPGDFKLVCLGSFDPLLGKFEVLASPESLGFATDYLPKPSLKAV